MPKIDVTDSPVPAQIRKIKIKVSDTETLLEVSYMGIQPFTVYTEEENVVKHPVRASFCNPFHSVDFCNHIIVNKKDNSEGEHFLEGWLGPRKLTSQLVRFPILSSS